MPETKVQPSAKTQQSIESIFIKEFVKHLIINSKPKPKIDREIIERVKAKLSTKVEVPIIPLTKLKNNLEIKKMPSKPQLLRMQPSPYRIPKSNFFPTPQMPKSMQRTPERKIQAPKPYEKPKEELNLGKLRAILLDPKVTGIECQGAGKNLLINRGGLIQNSQANLSESEIKEILQDFSQKTKIPLISGIFKALYSNMLMTAIISETAGNRFIIEKHFGQPNLPKKEDVK